MKRHLSNAVYGVVDYASYPIGMLLVTPLILHRLGAAEYGLWMVATSIVSAGGIIASGFCDAGIQRVAKLRGAGENARLTHTVQVLLAINLALGVAMGLLSWWAAPALSRHLAISAQASLRESLLSLRIASVLIPIRALETVGVCVQRAFEDYGGTVRISVSVRLLTLAFAAALAARGGRTVSVMVATGMLLAAGAFLQLRNLRIYLGRISFVPISHRGEGMLLLSSGIFVWLQAVGSVVFRQLDRILLGGMLGSALVAPYSLSVQLGEPLFGLTASGLSFFFPYLSKRAESISPQLLRRTVLRAFLYNLVLVLCGASVLLRFGGWFVAAWVGPAMARSVRPILPLIVIGAALSGLSVTGTYALQALGLFRVSAGISLGSRAVLLVAMLAVVAHHGLHGLATIRLLYGAASMLVYLPLLRRLSLGGSSRAASQPLRIAGVLQNGAER